jgi:hypothetical protein
MCGGRPARLRRWRGRSAAGQRLSARWERCGCRCRASPLPPGPGLGNLRAELVQGGVRLKFVGCALRAAEGGPPVGGGPSGSSGASPRSKAAESQRSASTTALRISPRQHPAPEGPSRALRHFQRRRGPRRRPFREPVQFFLVRHFPRKYRAASSSWISRFTSSPRADR